MKKPILFIDFDGTICFSKYWRSLDLEKYEQVQDLLFREDTRYVNEWMRGGYTAEEVNQKIAKAIDLPYEEVWNLFVKDCKTMAVDVRILERLNTLRSEYKVVLITGNMDSFSRFTKPALQLESYFDEVVNSYEIKKHKTDNDGEFFVEYTKKHYVLLEDCFVIDDSEKVCKTFENLGGTAYRVTPQLDILSYLNKFDK